MPNTCMMMMRLIGVVLVVMVVAPHHGGAQIAASDVTDETRDGSSSTPTTTTTTTTPTPLAFPQSELCFSQFLKGLFIESGLSQQDRRSASRVAIQLVSDNEGYWKNVRNLVLKSLEPGQHQDSSPSALPAQESTAAPASPAVLLILEKLQGTRGITEFNKLLRRYPGAMDQVRRIIRVIQMESLQQNNNDPLQVTQDPLFTPCQD